MSGQATPIFGIDLGTTYSAIAYVDEFGQPVVILNEDDEPVTASAIYFESPENVIVGKVAKTTGRVDPLQYVELIKPHMGDSTFRREVHGWELRPEQLSALILAKLKCYAESRLGYPVTDVVITVPAYFNEQRRHATEQAGIMAGLNVRQIIPEPTAAAIAYAATDGNERTILVYDLGGGTFDVTVMRVEQQKVRVVCVKGDDDLGGRKWDDRIAAYLASEWQQQHGTYDDPLASLETLQELVNIAEESKKQLTKRIKVPLKVTHASQSVRVELTRQKFDELTASLLETTIAMTRNAVEEAHNLGAPPIDLILLVGGSSRMPQVQSRLQSEFPGVELKLFDPELSVAKGAAIYANNTRIQETYKDLMQSMFGNRDVKLDSLPEAVQQELHEKATQALPGTTAKTLAAGLDMEVVNVCSKNFGLVVHDPVTRREEVNYLITRSTPVPATIEKHFGTLDDNQETVALQIIESASEASPLPTSVDDPSCQRLKIVTLQLPSGLRRGHVITVRYSLSEDGGRLRVVASDPASGRVIEDSVENVNAILADELEQMRERMNSVQFQ